MPAQSIPKNSVWTAMSYTPPRGRCNYKASLMAPACPCLRFMLHPVKAATSFECDGCAHHASFHLMENAGDDAVVRKWAEQEEKEKQGQAVVGAGRKRRRIADKPSAGTLDVVEVLEITEEGEEGETEARAGEEDWWERLRGHKPWVDEQMEGVAAGAGRRRKGKS